MRSMRYEQYKAKYWKKKMENPLPPLPEDERIYLNVPYMARDFARYSHCGFDPDRKLWFTKKRRKAPAFRYGDIRRIQISE